MFYLISVAWQRKIGFLIRYVRSGIKKNTLYNEQVVNCCGCLYSKNK
jgi:hypothetical protein